VGYGDMAPVTTVAQTLATTEALVGQVYLTILVARLVGMFLMHQQQPKE
ncbi:MAG: two pore domain potassium channel family protein, partial [Deltaproteobacteria bacterium]|nr:two pore domain potassium channel family protein [Deltaproteobacteria bacterium]